MLPIVSQITLLFLCSKIREIFATGEEQTSPKFFSKGIVEQPICFICTIYHGEHNGTVLLTHK